MRISRLTLGQFRRHDDFEVELAPGLDRMFCLGEGIAHGFLTLEPDSEVHYLMGGPYVAEAAGGLRWDDPAIGIAWPAEPAIVSERDLGYPLIGGAG